VRLAVVIPAYNDAATIADLAHRAARHAAIVIVVDDGSTDGTAAALADAPVTLIANARNLGKGASLARGIAHALGRGAEAIVTLDGDGQHDPDDIPRLASVAAILRDHVIVGARLRRREAAPRLRRAANRIGDFVVGWAAGQPLADSQSGFRLYPAALLARLDIPSGPGRGFVYESELMIEASRAGARVVSVPIDSVYRAGARPSHFRPLVDFARIGRMLAWKIASRGFYPAGLLRSLARPARTAAQYGASTRSDDSANTQATASPAEK
jgi:glycosyltransferase involved in cell wall biosynthesis